MLPCKVRSEHIEWLEAKLKEIESQIKDAIASDDDWKQKQKLLSLLDQGKLKKVALTACLHKLLILLNAMVRDGQVWQPQATG
jgi:transposase